MYMYTLPCAVSHRCNKIHVYEAFVNWPAVLIAIPGLNSQCRDLGLRNL